MSIAWVTDVANRRRHRSRLLSLRGFGFSQHSGACLDILTFGFAGFTGEVRFKFSSCFILSGMGEPVLGPGLLQCVLLSVHQGEIWVPTSTFHAPTGFHQTNRKTFRQIVSRFRFVF